MIIANCRSNSSRVVDNDVGVEQARELQLKIQDSTIWRNDADVVGDYESLGGNRIGALPGDANLDGAVNFVDFLAVSEFFGRDDTDWTDGDFDGDGGTDFADFLILSKNFGNVQNTA